MASICSCLNKSKYPKCIVLQGAMHFFCAIEHAYSIWLHGVIYYIRITVELEGSQYALEQT